VMCDGVGKIPKTRMVGNKCLNTPYGVMPPISSSYTGVEVTEVDCPQCAASVRNIMCRHCGKFISRMKVTLREYKNAFYHPHCFNIVRSKRPPVTNEGVIEVTTEYKLNNLHDELNYYKGTLGEAVFKKGFKVLAPTWLEMFEVLKDGYQHVLENFPEQKDIYERSDAYKTLIKAEKLLEGRRS